MANAPKRYGATKQQKPRRDTRKSASRRGYDNRWKKLRDAYIQHMPLCEHCAGRGVTTRAREVDHVQPFDGVGDPLRLDWTNLQSLCRSCHATKTARSG